MKFLLGLAALSAALAGCGADESQEGKSAATDGVPQVRVAECAAKQDSVERLSCFDSLAATFKARTIYSKTQPGVGSWHASSTNDPMTDQPVYVASLEARNAKGKSGGPVSLVIRCSKNKTDLYITWSSHRGEDDVSVTYRPGKDAPSTSSWSVSTDSKSALFPGSPVQLIRRIIQTDLFVAKVTPYGEGPMTAVFDTAGSDIALGDVRGGCRW